MRAWVVVAVVFSAVVVLWDILSLVGLLAGLITGLLLPDDPDKLPSNIMVGHTVGPFAYLVRRIRSYRSRRRERPFADRATPGTREPLRRNAASVTV
jgi:hypothetical protein